MPWGKWELLDSVACIVIAQRATLAEKLLAFLGILGDSTSMNVRKADFAATRGDAQITTSSEVERHCAGTRHTARLPRILQHTEMVASSAIAYVAGLSIERRSPREILCNAPTKVVYQAESVA